MKHTFDTETFSKLVKVKRIIELNIGVRDVGKILGVGASTVSRIENKNLPDIITYSKVCKWLGVPMEKFIKKSK